VDKYGNIPASQWSKAQSHLGASLDPAQRSHAGSKKRRTKAFKKSGEVYFAWRGPGRGARGPVKGIAIKRGRSQNVKFAFSLMKRQPSYRPRYHFHAEVQKYVRANYAGIFYEAVAEALRTAR